MKIFKNTIKTAVYVTLVLLLSGPVAYAQYENVSLRSEMGVPAKTGLTYDIYAGGMKALHATLDLSMSKKAYDVSLEAKTQGMIGKLFPWSATYSTSGHTDQGRLVPSLHTSMSEWRQKSKTTEMSFNPKGQVLKTTVQEGASTVVNRDIKEELSKDAVDMLTGTLMMMQTAKNAQKCQGTFPVFDGKRRYNISLKGGEMDKIKKSNYSSFHGAALKCTLRVEPVAGFKDKDKKRGWMAVQEHTEQRKKLPTVWLAQVDVNGPAVPVRMEIASDYGAVVAHLSQKQ